MLAIRFLFWTWLLVSLGVLLYRAYRRWGRRTDAAVRAGAGSSVEESAGSPTWGPVEPAVGPAGPASTAAVLARPDPVHEPAIDAARPASAAAGGRSSRPIAEVLVGIAMPCDLTPLLPVERRPDAFETVAFASSTYGPGDVRASLTAELERLGLEVGADREAHLVATSGADVLELEVHASPATVERGGVPAFPTAKAGDVVVEIWRR